jgi:signal transduction histidine kinase
LRPDPTRGLGLGLAIVRHLVVHGGRVDASSKGIGHGSSFRVALPAIEADGAVRRGLSASQSSAAV